MPFEEGGSVDLDRHGREVRIDQIDVHVWAGVDHGHYGARGAADHHLTYEGNDQGLTMTTPVIHSRSRIVISMVAPGNGIVPSEVSI